jgi:Methyltransferase domain
MVPDQSIDFVFSYDSLVHADTEVLSAYLSEVARVLTPTGAAFLHHSNLSEYAELLTAVSKYQLLGQMAVKLGWLDGYLHWRDPHVSGRWFADAAASRGLVCLVQASYRCRSLTGSAALTPATPSAPLKQSDRRWTSPHVRTRLRRFAPVVDRVTALQGVALQEW